jgi:ABC-type transporter Mla subunit MlaD
MTVNQYDLEDKVTTASDMAESFQQESKALAQVPEQVALAMNEAGAFLRQVYDDLAAVGNEAGMNLISASWERIEFMGTKNVVLANHGNNADEIIEFINDERLNVIAKLEDLETAIENNDTSHPSLEDFAYYLRQEAVDSAFGDAYEAALSEAESTIFDDIMGRVQTLTGCDSYQGYCFTRMLNSRREITPQQVQLLTELTNTFRGKS